MSMADRDGWIWMDGQFVPWRDAKIHVLTHSLHYGMAVFEGVRAYKTGSGSGIFRLREHTQRLMNSAKIFQMKVPFDAATLEQVQKDIVKRNSLESCYIRPIIWVGSESSASPPAITRFTSRSRPGPGAPISEKKASPKAFA
jgi:branched-chain amino acid aminotransferase